MENRVLDKNSYIGKYKSYNLKNITLRTHFIQLLFKILISTIPRNNKQNEVYEEFKKLKITTGLFDLDLNNINCKPAINYNFIIVHFFQISMYKIMIESSST